MLELFFNLSKMSHHAIRQWQLTYCTVVGGGPQCLWPLIRRSTLGVALSLITHRHHLCPCLRHCDHSVSEWSSWVSDYSLTRALARRLLEASGLALFDSCVSPILGHARALLLACAFLSLSRQRPLSRQLSAVSLVSGFSRSRVSLVELSLVSWHVSLSLSRRATRLASRTSSSVSSPSRVSPPSLCYTSRY